MPNDIARKSKFARELYHSSTIDIERHKEAAAFGFVLGWNRQTRSDYLFVISRLMKIRLMMTRKTGHGPGRCATNTHNLIEAHILLIPLKISLSKLFRDIILSKNNITKIPRNDSTIIFITQKGLYHQKLLHHQKVI